MFRLAARALIACALAGCLDSDDPAGPALLDTGVSAAGADGGGDAGVAPADAGSADAGSMVNLPDGGSTSTLDASSADAGAMPDAAHEAGSHDAGANDAGSPDAGSYQEVFDQGLTKYVGTPQVRETEVTSGGDAPSAIDVHHFSGENRGPLCMYGDEFFVETREGASDTLMIFLQGGGVCLSEICAATPAPTLSLQLFDLAAILGIGGLLDPNNPDNPAKDFDVVAAPYCDGSLFSGDVDRVLSDGLPDNGTQDRAFQRGLQNLTATLETAHRYFPSPKRIVLVGSSGGAYGIVTAVPLTRRFYPDTPLLAVSDSGAPIVNGVDKGFIMRALSELQATALIPRSCPDCLANGHATGMLEWALRIDPQLSIAYMTHARDHVIGEFFMRTTADQFEAAVVAETDRLLQSFPGRAFRFVIPGARHTLAMGMDDFDDETQAIFLGFAGVLVGTGIGFTGDQVDADELASWTLGGMRETGTDDTGKAWTGYAWLKSLLQDPGQTPSVLQVH